jgi:hypothetical protein
MNDIIIYIVIGAVAFWLGKQWAVIHFINNIKLISVI